MYDIKQGRSLIVQMNWYQYAWWKIQFSIVLFLILEFTAALFLFLDFTNVISARSYMTIFLALQTLAWHTEANFYCAWISSYRFKNPSARYFKIKNKFIRKLFVRPMAVEGSSFANKSDHRTNIIGFVLNIINILLFISTEILLLMPKIPCAPYVFTVIVGPRFNRRGLHTELHSLNEIIAAEVPRAFALLMTILFIVFLVLFKRRLEKHRQKIEPNTKKTPRQKPFKKTEWYSPLYNSLVDISVHQNNKKLKFWYKAEQLDEIKGMISNASGYAELKIEEKGERPISFIVVDRLNDHVVFTGYFLPNKSSKLLK